MKKIWLLCLCLASLSLVWCFHIPDEDWLPSKNKVNTWNIEEENEMDQALNDFMGWINMISSDWDEIKNEEDNGTISEEWEENTIEIKDETINDEEIIDNGVENEVVESEAVENEVVEENIPSDE